MVLLKSGEYLIENRDSFVVMMLTVVIDM